MCVTKIRQEFCVLLKQVSFDVFKGEKDKAFLRKAELT